MSGLLAGDSGGGGENKSASVGPPECNCCSSSHRDTQRRTSLHTFCRIMVAAQIQIKCICSMAVCPEHMSVFFMIRRVSEKASKLQ